MTVFSRPAPSLCLCCLPAPQRQPVLQQSSHIQWTWSRQGCRCEGGGPDLAEYAANDQKAMLSFPLIQCPLPPRFLLAVAQQKTGPNKAGSNQRLTVILRYHHLYLLLSIFTTSLLCSKQHRVGDSHISVQDKTGYSCLWSNSKHPSAAPVSSAIWDRSDIARDASMVTNYCLKTSAPFKHEFCKWHLW